MSTGKSLEAAHDQDQVDDLNTSFYGKIQYPWPPAFYERVPSRPDLWAKMLSQDIGAWDTPIIPEGGRVWVAGCGRNQALLTALRFPQALVVGSDLSEPSLAHSRETANKLGVRNLELRCESLNHVQYDGEFDYVLCTGVIHHNADPAVPLRSLMKAMKPAGVLELMVYNEYHRFLTAGFQRVVRTFLSNWQAPNYDDELALAQRFVALASTTTIKDWGFAEGKPRGISPMLAFLASYKGAQGGKLADALIQPVEHSYNIRTLSMLLAECGGKLLNSSLDQFSRTRDALTWNMTFPDSDLQKTYDALEDEQRWQITNLLIMEDSPMLWFYCQRADSNWARKSERQLAEEFCTRRYKRINTTCDLIPATNDRPGSSSTKTSKFPRGLPPAATAKKFLEAANDGEVVGDTISKIGLGRDFATVHGLRTQLATSGFPFLETI